MRYYKQKMWKLIQKENLYLKHFQIFFKIKTVLLVIFCQLLLILLQLWQNVIRVSYRVWNEQYQMYSLFIVLFIFSIWLQKNLNERLHTSLIKDLLWKWSFAAAFRSTLVWRFNMKSICLERYWVKEQSHLLRVVLKTGESRDTAWCKIFHC